MSDLPPSRRDEREERLAEIEREAEWGVLLPADGVDLFEVAHVRWLIAEVRSLSQQLDEARARVDALDRFNCTTGGCGDPDCCGTYGTMEMNSDGEWVRLDDVRASISSPRA